MRMPNVLLICATAGATLLSGFSGARADDRDLLRFTAQDPYVMIIFDVSGSMNWTPQCTSAQVAAGTCTYLCPTGDCLPRRQGDDPASKFVQAKEAIHEVLRDIDNVHFGFATYNQDDMRVLAKHWVYRVTSNGPTLGTASGAPRFPVIGQEVTFGAGSLDTNNTFRCDSGNNQYEIGCRAGQPADLNDDWELQRVLRHPKLDVNGQTTSTYYVRNGGTTYRVSWERIVGQSFGSLGSQATFSTTVRTRRCTDGSCTNSDQERTATVTYQRVGDFLSWDFCPGSAAQCNFHVPGFNYRTGPQQAFFPQGDSGQAKLRNSTLCYGWDPNDDTPDDRYSATYNLRWPTTADPRGPALEKGDVLPLDWTNKHRDLILQRLAPNGTDFGQASYFQDLPSGGQLNLRSAAERPILASGSTPIGQSMQDFETWYWGCEVPTVCGPDDPPSCVPCPAGSTGWRDIAAERDPGWPCRNKYIIVVTDGDEACESQGYADPCAVAKRLAGQSTGNSKVRTYVVGYGLPDTAGNTLECIAEDGGTTAPIKPQNKEELVTALTSIFGEIAEENRAFASATVPSVQADVSDRLYLTRFIPLNNEPVWPGSLNAFLKPLPFDDLGLPDVEKACEEDDEANCHLWDAGEVLLGQAPSAADVAGGTYNLGPNQNQRRVFYVRDLPTAAVPAIKSPFLPPTGSPGTCAGYPSLAGCSGAWWDLFEGFGLGPGVATATLQTRATTAIGKALAVKTATITPPDPDEDPYDVDYALGDLFHSDPLYVDRPLDFALYANDLFGYREFADRHRLRRKMVIVGANDGMLHAFDAGQWDNDEKRFSTGTGTELFAVVPRAAMPVLRDQATGTEQIYSMDGSPRLGDVFIDTDHNGTPTPADREWRSIVVAGMREGGNKFPSQAWVDRFQGLPGLRMRNAYVALDITQPDAYDGEGLPGTGVIPDCLTLNGSAPSGCSVFPSVLWEFRDENPSTRVRFDEDINGSPDLGDTWSQPILGRVKLANGESREVAVFGGGMDSDFRNGQLGNFVYMVDVETGRAIYKRRVIGSVPSEIAAQDRDNDGYLDTLYFGTTAGLVYKVDLRGEPDLVTVSARDLNGAFSDQLRVDNAAWTPFPIFQTGPAGASTPIYMGVRVFYLAKVGGYALAFGSGDREDLWSENFGPGRFYVIRDTGFAEGDLPLAESDYQRIDPESTDLVRLDLTLNPGTGFAPGWYMELAPSERVITRAFGLVTLLSFTSFNPQTEFIDVGEDELCARTGQSRIFAVDARNGDPLGLIDGSPARYEQVDDFVTPPTLEQVQTKNTGSGNEEPDEEPINPHQDAIIKSIMKSFPQGTRFANYYYALVQRTSRNEAIDPILIPVGIAVNNWKEF